MQSARRQVLKRDVSNGGNAAIKLHSTLSRNNLKQPFSPNAKADQPPKKAPGIPKINMPYKGLQARKSEQLGQIISNNNIMQPSKNNQPKFVINKLPTGLIRNDGLAPSSARISVAQPSPQKSAIYGMRPKVAENSNCNCSDRKQESVVKNNQLVRNEMDFMKEEMEQMRKFLQQKDSVINKQRTDITNLRKKNYEFRSKITELQDAIRMDQRAVVAGRDRGLRNLVPVAGRAEQQREQQEHDVDAVIQMRQDRQNQRERQMLLLSMMNGELVGQEGIEAAEERMLQQAIQASRGDADPNNPNPDAMTYEELLQLEDRNGKVSKGLDEEVINSLQQRVWQNDQIDENIECDDESCAICFENFEVGQIVKKLPACSHEYHSNCINKWLQSEKRCPVCNVEVINNE